MMLNRNANASSSSSSGSSGPALSNKEQKLLVALISDIHNNLKIPGSKSLATLIQNILSRNEGRGEKLLTLAVTNHAVTLTDKLTEKLSLVHFAVWQAMMNPIEQERQRMRDAIKLFLKYFDGRAHMNRHPVMLLFDNSDTCKNVRTAHQFIETLKLFLNSPEIFDIRGSNNGTNILHTASMFPCGSLLLLLEKRPEMINAVGKTGANCLFSAIAYKQTQNALRLINHPAMNLSQRNSQGGSALTSAIVIGDQRVTEALLHRGCPIDADTSFLTNTSPSLALLLAKAGYFLVDSHMSCIEGLAPIFAKHSSPETISNGFFCLESADGKTYESISTVNQLRSSKIVLSQVWVKRLHQSFLEVLEHLNKSDHPRNAYNHVNQLYEAFKIKYPLPDTVTLSITTSTTPQVELNTISMLCMLVRSVFIAAQSLPQINEFIARANKIFEAEEKTPSSNELLITNIKHFFNTILPLSKNLGNYSRDTQVTLIEFYEKFIYQYLQRLVLPFVLKASQSEVMAVINQISFIISVAAKHVGQGHEKSLLSFIETLDKMAERYEALDLPRAISHDLRLMSHTGKIVFYAECEFYSELIDIIDQTNKFSIMFIKKEYNDAIIQNLTLAIGNALDVMPNSIKQIDLKLKVLDAADRLLTTIRDKRSDLREVLKQISVIYAPKRAQLLNLRLNAIKDLLKSDPSIATLELYGENKIKVIFNKEFLEKIDKTQLNKELRSLDVKEVAGAFYQFTHAEFSIREITDLIGTLNKICIAQISQPKPPAENPAERTLEDQPYSSSSSSSSLFLESTPCIMPTRQPIKKDKQKAETVRAQTPIEPAINLAVIIAQIRIALKLPDTAVIFAIDHPGFPKERKHFCFGLWAEITGKNVTDIPEQTLSEHRELAVTGKVVTHAYGQNGLKPTKVRNENNILVDGLKTKFSKTDLRIHSAPVKVDIPAGQQALLYVFGVAAGHKEKAPKINVNAIIAQAKQL